MIIKKRYGLRDSANGSFCTIVTLLHAYDNAQEFLRAFCVVQRVRKWSSSRATTWLSATSLAKFICKKKALRRRSRDYKSTFLQTCIGTHQRVPVSTVRLHRVVVLSKTLTRWNSSRTLLVTVFCRSLLNHAVMSSSNPTAACEVSFISQTLVQLVIIVTPKWRHDHKDPKQRLHIRSDM